MKENACPICDEAFQADFKFGYLQDGAHVPTCERCHVALMNIVLLQILKQYRRGDPRKLLLEELRKEPS